MKSLFTFLGYLLISLISFAQEFKYNHYSTEEGLSSSIIYRVLQTSDGYVWIATDNGLSRFNGKRFVEFTYKEGLPDNEVLNLYEDQQQRLWISCYNSPPIFYYNKQLYTAANHSVLSKLPASKYISEFYEDTYGNIWMASSQYICKLDSNLEHAAVIPMDKGGSFILFNKQLDGEFLHFGADIYVMNVGDKHLSLIGPDPYQQQQGQFLGIKNFSVVDSLYILSIHKNKYKVIRFNAQHQIELVKEIETTSGISHSSVIHTGQTIITSDNGWKFLNDRLEPEEATFLQGKNISRVYEDAYRNIWFSTLGDGVYMLPYPTQSIFLTKTESENVSATCMTNHPNLGLVIGTSNGRIRSNKNNTEQIYAGINDLNDYKAISDIKTIGENIIIGSNRGLYLYNNKLELINESVEKDPIKCIAISANNDIFCGTSNHSFLYNSHLLIKDTLLDERSIAAHFDHMGTLWIATLNNLLTYKNGSLHREDWFLFAQYGRPARISSSEKLPLIIASYNSGVIIYANNRTLQITTKDGLASNICKDLLVDSSGIIWVATSKGVSKIEFDYANYQLKKVSNFNESHGLVSANCLSLAYYNQTVWVGTDAGYSPILAANLNLQDVDLPIYPEKIIVNNKKEIQFEKGSILRLKHNENNISVIVDAISYNTKGDVIFIYTYNNDHAYTNKTTSNVIELVSLPPGNYSLSIKAIDINGVESKESIDINFLIEKPLYQRAEFIILIAFTIGLITLLLIRYRISVVRQSLNRKNTIEKQIIELKLDALRAQMKPHFFFNAINSVQSFLIRNKDVQAQQYLKDFSQLIRKTLDQSNSNYITIAEEMDYLSRYLQLEKWRMGDKLEYTIHSDLNDNTAFKIPTQILQPFVENALLHGIKLLEEHETGNIDILFVQQNDQIVCTIKDNGIGINKSMQLKNMDKSKHYGVLLSTERIKMYNQLFGTQIQISIKDLATSGKKGTEVIITLPIA